MVSFIEGPAAHNLELQSNLDYPNSRAKETTGSKYKNENVWSIYAYMVDTAVKPPFANNGRWS